MSALHLPHLGILMEVLVQQRHLTNTLEHAAVRSQAALLHKPIDCSLGRAKK
jgi:hypothetical protein